MESRMKLLNAFYFLGIKRQSKVSFSNPFFPDFDISMPFNFHLLTGMLSKITSQDDTNSTLRLYYDCKLNFDNTELSKTNNWITQVYKI